MDHSALLDLVELVLALRRARRESVLPGSLVDQLEREAEEAINLMYQEFRHADD